ncbi:MAG: DUF1553 domain-containing protein [Verrucomicrobiaceae bacterium]|nr:DUF1553 domain-containing protein [Verrucomicrobiaceae bacterium]
MTALRLVKPVLTALLLASAASAEVGYNRDVRPILSDRCFKCHGFDSATRKADLRLDVREAALEVIESGELMNRLTTSDPEEVMPPPKDHAPLKEKEIALLKQWIAEGAKYEAHWAFVPPKSSTLTSIDAIVRSRLAQEGLKPSPSADDATLRRRVALALTGLPTHETHKTYANLVDALLSSPHFGERLAIDWLDAARYADTNGYYTDAERQAWPWRDWVIRAFNDNMPFDRFTIEQLAGDLLPEATLDQKIATAFNRNHTVTNETGIIDEEYRVSYVADRVETTAATWLGLTMGCAKCHDHKFDPITMRDYYALFAAFNNLDEKGIIKDVAAPVIELPTEAQTRQITDLAAKRQKLESRLKSARPALDSEIIAWEPNALQTLPASPSKGESARFSFDGNHLDHGPKSLKANVTGKTSLKPGVKGSATMLDATQYVDFADPWPLERDRAFTLSVWINPGSSPQGCVASKQDSDSQARGFEILWYKAQPRINLAHRYGNDGIEVVAKDKFSGGQWRHLVITYDGSSKAAGLKVYVDGKLSEVDVRRDSLSGSIASKEPWRIGWKGTGIGFEGGMDEFRLFDRAISAAEVNALHWREFLEGTLVVKRDQRPKSTAEKLESYFIDHHGTPELQTIAHELAKTRTAEADAKKGVLSLAVMQEMPKPRETRVLNRGQYDQPADAVTFAVPASLGQLDEKMPRNRLGLAQWLVSKDNPLTARVMVNRLWTMCFGEGLVRTPNDFGLQGEAPINAELLDFLAVRFRDGDAHTKPWDVKGLLKLVVTSETFQQSSNFTPELLARDPDNRLLARGPRFRLPAEVIRDQALALSGLLVPKIGGPSVKPPQPAGLWEAVSYNGEASYLADKGDAAHRRGLYTFWKRQSPPPDMLTLDGPTREVCTVRRPRTNTPLQALLLLNDENYLEAARALAQLILKEKDHRIEWAFHRVTGRHASAREIDALRAFFNAQRAASNETQAWTMLASLLLNLDEVQTLH